jgi:hypothetical protein
VMYRYYPDEGKRKEGIDTDYARLAWDNRL